MGMRCSLKAAPASAARKLVADPEALEDFFAAAKGARRSLRLEKSWHGLHYVLTGMAGDAANPLGFLVSGGKTVGEVDDEDEAVVPARLLLPEYVQRLNAALAKFTSEKFDRRFDLKKLAREQIYPDIWGEAREDLLNEYRMYFESLKRFVHSAAEHGEAVLVMIG